MKTITIYHSPDADDAFMFYGLQSGAINIPGYEFNHELKDIESLNHMAMRGELEVTAVSVHAYAYLADKYSILSCGASMGGENYGPRLVVRSDGERDLRKLKSIAIPGEKTSATLALKLFLEEKGLKVELVNTFFDHIQKRVIDREVDAGLLIHEGQITSHKDGLVTIGDLGECWFKKTKLPLPLGVNIVRKDLGIAGMSACYQALKASIHHSLDNRSEALKYALSYGRGLSTAEADEFVGMYVNEKTLDLGDDGRESIQLFLDLAAKSMFIPASVQAEFISK